MCSVLNFLFNAGFCQGYSTANGYVGSMYSLPSMKDQRLRLCLARADHPGHQRKNLINQGGGWTQVVCLSREMLLKVKTWKTWFYVKYAEKWKY